MFIFRKWLLSARNLTRVVLILTIAEIQFYVGEIKWNLGRIQFDYAE